MSRQWTPQQKQAIRSESEEILVSAAAGSGKTAVLIERIMHQIRKGVPVERMLIVTFTKAAAGEMRKRLSETLEKEAIGNSLLQEAYEQLDQAAIQTLHSFCSDLIKRYFQEAGCDPQARTTDDSTTGPMLNEAIQDAVGGLYESLNDDINTLTDWYPAKSLEQMAAKLYKDLRSRPDSFEWLKNSLVAYDRDSLIQSPLWQDAANEALMNLSGALQLCGVNEELLTRPNAPAHYQNAITDDRALVLSLMEAVETKGYFPVLPKRMWTALGRGKKGDVFDPALVEEIKAVRDKMKEAAQKALDILPQGEEKLELWLHLENLSLPARRGLAMLCQEVDRLYSAAKEKANLRDYNDLEHFAYRALKDEKVARAVSRRFRHIFVDEYQDISPLQEAILSKIHQGNNLFMVGDVKQSIYRFRNADPTLFIQKSERFKEDAALGELVHLGKNFRSLPNILLAVNEVFEGAMRKNATEIDYLDEDKLYPCKDYQGKQPPVELRLIVDEGLEDADDPDLENDEEMDGTQKEAALIAGRIKELLSERYEKENRLYRLSDMVILLRAGANKAETYQRALEEAGIACRNMAQKSQELLSDVSDLQNLLECLVNPYRDELLISALGAPQFGFSLEDLLRFRAQTGKGMPMFETLENQRENDERLNAAFEKLERWRFLSRSLPLSRFIWLVVRESGLYAYAGIKAGGDLRKKALRNYIKSAEESGLSLDQFLLLGSSQEVKEDTGENQVEEAVRIYTIHKSKGLEFPVVFLADLAKNFRSENESPDLRIDQDGGIALRIVDKRRRAKTDTLSHRVIKQKRDRMTKAEEARLLYVAMTRAEDRLIMVASLKKIDNRLGRWSLPVGDYAAASASCLLDWVGLAMYEHIKELTDGLYTGISGASWALFFHSDVQAASATMPRPVIRKERLMPRENAALLEKLRTKPKSEQLLKTSVTALVQNELSDEEETPEDKRRAMDEEEVPTTKGEDLARPDFEGALSLTAAQRGSLSHRFLALIDYAPLQNLSGESLAAELEKQLQALLARNVFTQKEAAVLDIRMAKGFLESELGKRARAAKTLRRETPFTYKHGEVYIQGVCDLCFLEEGRWVLCDYKTDRNMAAAKERYARQLSWYARALAALTGKPVKELWLFSLRQGKAIPVSFETAGLLDANRPEG